MSRDRYGPRSTLLRLRMSLNASTDRVGIMLVIHRYDILAKYAS